MIFYIIFQIIVFRFCAPYLSDMGRFKKKEKGKGSLARKLTDEEMKFLTDHTSFTQDHIKDWHKVFFCYQLVCSKFCIKEPNCNILDVILSHISAQR